MMKLGETIAAGLVGSAVLFGAPAAAQDGASLFAQMCFACHDGVQHPKDLVYNAAGNVAIIEAVNAKGMGASGSLADHTSIAAYLDSVKPTINMAPVPHDSPGTFISLRDIIVSAAEIHADWKIIFDIVTVSPPTKGTVSYTVANGFGFPTLVTYTPFPGQSGVDTWTYQGTGPEANTTVRTASVYIASDGTPPPSGTTVAVEYYYADWNFYFVTSLASEIAALDGGAFGGVWKRTGETFNVWSDSANGALATHRFFSTGFSPRSSHFYTPYVDEYNSLKAGTVWEYEGIAFYVQLPDANGNCPAGTVILYRLYNNGLGGAPNHRFTISVATFNAMKAAGWQFEGNGLTGAYACVPQ
jgi:hypothetical protein